MEPQPAPLTRSAGTSEAGTSTQDLPRLLPPLEVYFPPPAPAHMPVSQFSNLISTDNKNYSVLLFCFFSNTRIYLAMHKEGLTEAGGGEAAGEDKAEAFIIIIVIFGRYCFFCN